MSSAKLDPGRVLPRGRAYREPIKADVFILMSRLKVVDSVLLNLIPASIRAAPT